MARPAAAASPKPDTVACLGRPRDVASSAATVSAHGRSPPARVRGAEVRRSAQAAVAALAVRASLSVPSSAGPEPPTARPAGGVAGKLPETRPVQGDGRPPKSGLRGKKAQGSQDRGPVPAMAKAFSRLPIRLAPAARAILRRRSRHVAAAASSSPRSGHSPQSGFGRHGLDRDPGEAALPEATMSAGKAAPALDVQGRASTAVRPSGAIADRIPCASYRPERPGHALP